ncbi:hypothetical protein ACFV0T_28040 [Streptomyces sp. NPDC059582]|uniref:hypothetical protein n=1 Tax=Streptomyces sp. NPDC059582 TaxID=3346875 RepID=UPI0036CA5AB8
MTIGRVWAVPQARCRRDRAVLGGDIGEFTPGSVLFALGPVVLQTRRGRNSSHGIGRIKYGRLRRGSWGHRLTWEKYRSAGGGWGAVELGHGTATLPTSQTGRKYGGIHVMISASLRARFAGCAALASAFLLTSCTSDGEPGNAAGSRSSEPGISRTGTASSEAELTKQVQDALAAVSKGTLVEAGTERVSDGIHTEPGLNQGKTYRLNLICVGSGSAQVKFTPTITGAETAIPCDQSLVQQRITALKSVRIDVDGADGSTGVIGWQLDAT